MASVSDEADGLNCAICFEQYTEPRFLPGCTHCFCESCIVNFVLELKKDETLGSEFSCPVCKLPSNSPGMDDSVQRWVATLEINEEIKTKSGTENDAVESSDTDRRCRQCLLNEKNILADKYCFTCRREYCDACSKTLHTFEVNKMHTVVTLPDTSMGIGEEGLKTLSEFSTCPKHPAEEVTFYCKDDKMFCCTSCCVDSHKLCRHVESVVRLMEQTNMETEFTKLQKLIDNLSKHIHTVIGTIKEKNNENKKKAEELMIRFQEKKQKVINLLDAMEANLNDEGKAAVKNAALKNQDEIDDLERMKRELQTHLQLLERAAEKFSTDKSFVWMYKIERKVEDIEQQIIRKGKEVKSNGLELITSDTFKLIENLGPNETAQLASIVQPEATIVVPAYEDRAFLRKHNIEAVSSHNIVPLGANADLEKPDTTPTYNDVLFLPEHKLLLVDSFHGFCCIVSQELSPSNRWNKLSNTEPDPENSYSNERHATLIDTNMIAVSIALRKKILLVTADGTYTSKGDIKCRYVPKAICGLHNGDIAVAWDKPVAFGIISGQIWPCQGKVFHGTRDSVSFCEKSYFTKDSAGRELKSFQSMAIDEDRHHVVQPCKVDKVVYCFDMDANPVFRYSNEQLGDPGGVALDSERNIYVCEVELGLIHIISPDGIGVTIVNMAKEGCPCRPLAITFDMASNKFVVTTDGPTFDEVHFFEISSR